MFSLCLSSVKLQATQPWSVGPFSNPRLTLTGSISSLSQRPLGPRGATRSLARFLLVTEASWGRGTRGPSTSSSSLQPETRFWEETGVNPGQGLGPNALGNL